MSRPAPTNPTRNNRSPQVSPDRPALVLAGDRVDLREHTPANRDAFIRWYEDPEIAQLLRHDLKPLSRKQATSYFFNIILPLSERGHCWAIHRHDTGQLIGTAAVTDVSNHRRSCLFRIVIGEKDAWGHGRGTEATRLVAHEVFATLPVDRIHLEVFAHNPRARRTYERVGFHQFDEYRETVPGSRTVIEIVAMELRREALASNMPSSSPAPIRPIDALPD